MLDRLPEAVGCLTQAIPLQSMPDTISDVIYNRALLQALSGSFHKSLATFGLVLFYVNSQFLLEIVFESITFLHFYMCPIIVSRKRKDFQFSIFILNTCKYLFILARNAL